jgi:hypothetical protein
MSKKSSRPSYGAIFEAWQQCQKDLKKAKSERAFETVNFRFACREFSEAARTCIIKKYNENLNAKIPPIDKRIFMDEGSNVTNYTRLEWAFVKLYIPYALLRYIRYFIRAGDKIAHKFNKKNHTDLNELKRKLFAVDADADEKDAFKKLAVVWKTRLCENAGKYKPYN